MIVDWKDSEYLVSNRVWLRCFLRIIVSKSRVNIDGNGTIHRHVDGINTNAILV